MLKELPEGKAGLIHISEVADVYVKDVHDFSEKDKVKVKVLSIDDRGKIALSIKQLQEKKPKPRLRREILPSDRSARAAAAGFRRGGHYNNTTASFEDKLEVPQRQR